MKELNTMTDYELVQLYEQGNDRAFDALLNRHQGYVYSYILFLVHTPSKADDIFQETFARAVMAIRNHRYQMTGKFSAWLVRIAHNLVIDQAREENYNNITLQENFSSNVTNNKQYSEEPLETKIIAQQNIDTLNQLLDFLPQVQREVVRLHFYEDLTFREIADKMGISINTALGRMRYALINLRKLIQKHQLSLVG